MKKLVSLTLTLLFAFNLLATPAMATDSGSDYTICYDDGSYAIVTHDDGSARSNTNEIINYTYYNPQNQRCFAYTLYASFTYNGITSRADSCEYAAEIFRHGWDMTSHSEYVSGNTAYGNATFTGPDGQTRKASLTLTCDKNGNVT